MADINAQLKKAMDGPAPQHKVQGQEAFEPTEGSGGNLHVKDNLLFEKVAELMALIEAQETKTQIVKDTDVLNKLGQLESKIQSTNDRLNQTLNTQLTGNYIKEKQVATDIIVNGGSSASLSVEDFSSADYFSFAVRGTSSHDFLVTAQRQTLNGEYLDNGVSDRLTVLDITSKQVALSGRFDVTASKMMFVIRNEGLDHQTYDAYLYKFGYKVG